MLQVRGCRPVAQRKVMGKSFVSRAATSNSSTCGRVKFLRPMRWEESNFSGLKCSWQCDWRLNLKQVLHAPV